MALIHPNNGSYWRITGIDKENNIVHFKIYKSAEHRQKYNNENSNFHFSWMPMRYTDFAAPNLDAMLTARDLTEQEKIGIVNPMNKLINFVYDYVKTLADFTGFIDV